MIQTEPKWAKHFSFIVDGLPKGKGSMRPIKTKGGKVILVHSKDSVEFQELCTRAALHAAERLRSQTHRDVKLNGPVAVQMVFYLPRPQGHFGTGKNENSLRASAPAFPAIKPDIDKLVRVALDSMTGIAFHDDAQVVAIRAIKRYASLNPQLAVVVYRPELEEEGAA